MLSIYTEAFRYLGELDINKISSSPERFSHQSSNHGCWMALPAFALLLPHLRKMLHLQVVDKRTRFSNFSGRIVRIEYQENLLSCIISTIKPHAVGNLKTPLSIVDPRNFYLHHPIVWRIISRSVVLFPVEIPTKKLTGWQSGAVMVIKGSSCGVNSNG